MDFSCHSINNHTPYSSQSLNDRETISANPGHQRSCQEEDLPSIFITCTRYHVSPAS